MVPLAMGEGDDVSFLVDKQLDGGWDTHREQLQHHGCITQAICVTETEELQSL
jgi:hypothetical protein